MELVIVLLCFERLYVDIYLCSFTTIYTVSCSGLNVSAKHIVKIDGRAGLFKGLGPRLCAGTIGTLVHSKVVQVSWIDGFATERFLWMFLGGHLFQSFVMHTNGLHKWAMCWDSVSCHLCCKCNWNCSFWQLDNLYPLPEMSRTRHPTGKFLFLILFVVTVW